MKRRFKTEKAAREETIGRAVAMAQVAASERRPFTEREQRKIDALLMSAETLGLEKAIPRAPDELIAWVDRPKKTKTDKRHVV